MMREENVLPKMTWPTTSTRLQGRGVGAAGELGSSPEGRMMGQMSETVEIADVSSLSPQVTPFHARPLGFPALNKP